MKTEAIQNDDLQIDIYTYEFSDEKHLKKFISSSKRLIRNSLEYKDWVSYIKLTKGYNSCQFTHENLAELSVDIHHHPYSMESLVRVVLENQIEKYQRVNTLDVAKEVLELHYNNYIGYVLLISSLHEKFHNGFLQIPIDIVNGNWKKLSEIYTIPEEVSEVVNKYRMVRISDVTKLKWDDEFLIYSDGSESDNDPNNLVWENP